LKPITRGLEGPRVIASAVRQPSSVATFASTWMSIRSCRRLSDSKSIDAHGRRRELALDGRRSEQEIDEHCGVFGAAQFIRAEPRR
jgi:hypothetical protein